VFSVHNYCIHTVGHIHWVRCRVCRVMDRICRQWIWLIKSVAPIGPMQLCMLLSHVIYVITCMLHIVLTASSRNCNVMVWHPSVCLVSIHTMTCQGAACYMANVHFGPTIRRTDVLVLSTMLYISKARIFVAGQQIWGSSVDV